MDKAIAYLLAIAEKKSITEAAKSLYISQPSLSRYLSSLEKQLGLNLFTRTVEGTELTEAGKLYVQYARAIQQNYTALKNKMKEQRRVQANTLNICTCLNPVTLTTHEIMKAYQEKYPKGQLRISNVLTKDFPQLLATGNYQFAIGPKEVGQDTYDYRMIYADEYLLLVPTSFPLLPAIRQKKEDLPRTRLAEAAGFPFVLQDRNTNVRRNIDKICRQEQIKLENFTEVTSSVLAIRAVENQQGIAIIPSGFLPFASGMQDFRCYYFTEAQSRAGILFPHGKIFSPQEKFCISLIDEILHRESKICRKLALETWEEKKSDRP